MFNMRDKLMVNTLRNRKDDVCFNLGGFFHVQHIRKNLLIAEFDIKNIVVNQGLNYALSSCFDEDHTNPAAYNYWWISLMDNDGVGVAGDTYAAHAGWSEYELYTGDRKNWLAAGDHVAAQAITNAASVDFTINGAAGPPDYVRGIYLVSDGTDGGASNIELKGDQATADAILWSTAEFAADLSVVDTDVIKITYTVNASTT